MSEVSTQVASKYKTHPHVHLDFWCEAHIEIIFGALYEDKMVRLLHGWIR